ncbi:ABC transporter ATP-binding protein [Weizmannia acidilactici]|uniref:ABC transporter ATP-binding protein n=1 Tax=Weizmannia acidilactici TaxID=2607726 RepID=A0A5J4J1H8_9BACI|nr:ABC transporter ATP-binding protein [Weizmannia acidilactici]GER67683.1 ABC transporter ATP-binding protein [Weizmannia acidilactici]GER68922.1 ABC transporter ATP-binding protein [Weizmannia acidilactici]GER73898.1 ABC transporter ATP-binding protein [Weizmannia acidilactici]
MNLLEIKGLTKNFGGLAAVSNVNLNVPKNSITAVIGPNGAGKTTLFNMVTGVYKPSAGDILLNGEPITGLKPHAVARKGIARTFQNIRLFGSLSVMENVLIGMHSRLKSNFFGAVFQLPGTRREEEAAQMEAFELLQYVGLDGLLNEPATNLPYGAQRRLEIARALAVKPKLLLLDEPAAGMNPKETKELTDLIRNMCGEKDLTIILIEHDMKLVMEISNHIAVLDHGENIAEGKPVEIRNNPRVIEAYLGKGALAYA